MTAKRSYSFTVDRKVTIKLHGWPEEVRMISTVAAHWMVDLQFHDKGSIKTVPYFASDDYTEANAKYRELKAFLA